jgi:hypothetical protein
MKNYDNHNVGPKWNENEILANLTFSIPLIWLFEDSIVKTCLMKYVGQSGDLSTRDLTWTKF